jgi:hypothetical protein
MIKDLGGKEINKKGGSKKCFIPKLKWHGCISEESKTNLDYMPMFALS